MKMQLEAHYQNNTKVGGAPPLPIPAPNVALMSQMIENVKNSFPGILLLILILISLVNTTDEDDADGDKSIEST